MIIGFPNYKLFNSSNDRANYVDTYRYSSFYVINDEHCHSLILTCDMLHLSIGPSLIFVLFIYKHDLQKHVYYKTAIPLRPGLSSCALMFSIFTDFPLNVETTNL